MKPPATQASTAADLQAFLRDHAGVVVYFSTPGCAVCQALRPKLEALIAADFPRLAWITVDCQGAPQIAAHYGVLSVPTVVVFFDGREWLRKVRNFGLDELRVGLARPYDLLFGGDPGV